MTDDRPPPPADDAPVSVRFGRRRRAPRYGSFVATGVIVGVVLAIVLSLSRPATGEFSQNSVIGYVAAIFGLVGALLGAGLAVVLDRRHALPEVNDGADSSPKPR
jgi:hypothetical protein